MWIGLLYKEANMGTNLCQIYMYKCFVKILEL